MLVCHDDKGVLYIGSGYQKQKYILYSGLDLLSPTCEYN